MIAETVFINDCFYLCELCSFIRGELGESPVPISIIYAGFQKKDLSAKHMSILKQLIRYILFFYIKLIFITLEKSSQLVFVYSMCYFIQKFMH